MFANLEHTYVVISAYPSLEKKWLDIMITYEAVNNENILFSFSCDQAALQIMVFSVCLSICPSVCLSVCHTFLTMFPSSYHHEIFRSYYQWPK